MTVRFRLIINCFPTWIQAIDLNLCRTNNGSMPEANPKKRITRDQWLSKGLELFAVMGAEGLRVEKLARALGVAKSGFYWHFRDREELLDRLLDHWAHEYTEVLSRNSQLLQLPPRNRLLMIMTMAFERNLSEYDAAMQMWSKTDSRVARMVRKVNNIRLDTVRAALEELGFNGEDLEMRTRLFVGFQMGERQIFGASRKVSRQYRELRLDMLLGETQ